MPVLSVRGMDVSVTEDILSVRLEDGRNISVPLVWFPRLVDATEAQRRNWKLIGRGIGIHWPDLDEDISVDSLLATRGEDLLAYTDRPTPPTTDVQSGIANSSVSKVSSSVLPAPAEASGGEETSTTPASSESKRKSRNTRGATALTARFQNVAGAGKFPPGTLTPPPPP